MNARPPSRSVCRRWCIEDPDADELGTRSLVESGRWFICNRLAASSMNASMIRALRFAASTRPPRIVANYSGAAAALGDPAGTSLEGSASSAVFAGHQHGAERSGLLRAARQHQSRQPIVAVSYLDMVEGDTEPFGSHDGGGVDVSY